MENKKGGKMKVLDKDEVGLEMALDMLDRLPLDKLEVAQEHINELREKKFGKENKQ
jgi:hypothetical protein